MSKDLFLYSVSSAFDLDLDLDGFSFFFPILYEIDFNFY